MKSGHTYVFEVGGNIIQGCWRTIGHQDDTYLGSVRCHCVPHPLLLSLLAALIHTDNATA